MKLLEDRIIKDGISADKESLNVDSFIGRQIDISFISELGNEIYNLFKDEGITKIVTLEASGISLACMTAQHFNVPVVIARKLPDNGIMPDTYSSRVHSYARKDNYDIVISKSYLNRHDNVLIVDDMLAKGSSLTALLMLIDKSGAKIAGAGIAIEKAFCGGGNLVRDMGIRVESLAKIKEISKKGGVVFA